MSRRGDSLSSPVRLSPYLECFEMNGKGSKPRSLSVDRKQFERNWDKIFEKKTEKPAKSDKNAGVAKK